LRPSPAVWAAVALFAWSLVAIAVDAEEAPPVSVLVVLALGIGLSVADNRRMRTTGRLLLAFLAVIYATAELGADRALVPLLGVALAAVVAALAIVELVRGRR
jgi:lipopolysaccharide export LptBFGC system permease protein LptF